MEVVRDGAGEDGLVVSGGQFVVEENGDTVSHWFWGFSQQSGMVLQFEQEMMHGKPVHTITTRGAPSGIAVDSSASRVFVADLEHGAILKAEVDGDEFTPIVQEYENKRLLGPSSIAIGPDGTIFFTDSGPLGESTLAKPNGSVFAITRDNNGQILRPLALNCFAHPCGITVNADGTVFVCETLKNRIVRFVKRPHGAYVGSVLHQFSGRLGPSAIACDPVTNLLYVARFDFEQSLPALVSVIDPSGKDGGHVRDMEIPECGGSMISCMTVNADMGELYIFEASSGRTVRVKL